MGCMLLVMRITYGKCARGDEHSIWDVCRK